MTLAANAADSSPSHLYSVPRVAMPEADSEQEVYYEDLIGPPTKPERPTTGPKVKETEVKATSASVSAPDKVPAQENAVPNPLKRQRTLVDMFSGSSAKKTKVDGSSAAVVSKAQTLNSIPFNLNGFINSLTEEQRDLLGLEIGTMGKSWSVSTSPSLPQNTVSIPDPPIGHHVLTLNLP
jgi:hypothetical protein